MYLNGTELQFEELPIADGSLVDGVAEIYYADDGEDFEIGSIRLEGSSRWIDESDDGYAPVAAALLAHRQDAIDEAIGEHMSLCDMPRRNPNDEHRLGRSQLI